MSDSAILSYEEAFEKEKQLGDKLPVIEVEKNNQALLFFGAHHVNNPDHPQFKNIESHWRDFVQLHTNCIALVEGHFDEASEEDTKERLYSIIEGGEAQFLVYLARTYNISVASPEPDQNWEANQLATEFDRSVVVLYYFIRYVNLWNGYDSRPNMRQESRRALVALQRQLKWKDVDFSFEHIETLHKKLYNKPLDLDDGKWADLVSNPYDQSYETNEIARRSGELRDQYILGQIQQYWRAGKSIFIVFGSSHAVRLEPALRSL